jgi:hypothetical protein
MHRMFSLQQNYSEQNSKSFELHMNLMFSTVVIIVCCVCFNSYQEAEHTGVSVCISPGCEHARQAGGESLHLCSLSLIEKPLCYFIRHVLLVNNQMEPVWTRYKQFLLLRLSEQFVETYVCFG